VGNFTPNGVSTFSPHLGRRVHVKTGNVLPMKMGIPMFKPFSAKRGVQETSSFGVLGENYRPLGAAGKFFFSWAPFPLFWGGWAPSILSPGILPSCGTIGGVPPARGILSGAHPLLCPKGGPQGGAWGISHRGGCTTIVV